jgi:hypothetical protein
VTIKLTSISLQILSVSKNKLTRLPTYLSSFHKLSVFKVDHNPLEWPPPEALDLSSDISEPQAMAHRLRDLKKWLEENPDDKSIPSTHLELYPSGLDYSRYSTKTPSCVMFDPFAAFWTQALSPTPPLIQDHLPMTSSTVKV